jgi:hypothetical protein
MRRTLLRDRDTFRRRGAHIPEPRGESPFARDGRERVHERCDTAWGRRPLSYFSLAEVSTLLYDPAVPQDRRVCYALYFLGCTRFGEASALRWRHYESEKQPLGQLTIARSYSTQLHLEKETKSERPRRVPVTSQLAAILARLETPRLAGHVLAGARARRPDRAVARAGRTPAVEPQRESHAS